MDEIRLDKIPIPIINYVYLIKDRQSPYYDIVQFLLKDMEFRLANAQKNGQSEITYTINPRILIEEIELLVQEEKAKEKLTACNICRTIRAACLTLSLEGKLKKGDFYVSTTSGGRPNYHLKINLRTVNAFRLI